ncbi:transposase [Oleiphilus messinensis]|uniref:Transposase n=1 Tax=Oleiphilus messinensis TaxID=141451 RepID=A0A1Y0IH13_9GAMM|nr:transposase [Oleiphilus messinensis]ARU58815.1 transposase [Oleiphilus messinensis]
MARKPRFNLTDYPQYIMQRGHNRLPCFFDQQDYEMFLESLEKAATQYQCEIHAYALLKTEAHIIVTPRVQGGVSQMMQSLGRRYVQYMNHRYHRSGTLWEGRYKSSLIDSSAYMITCTRYIESLPVDMGLSDSEATYPWSSYQTHAGGQSNPVLKPHEMYNELGEDEGQRCEVYRELFGFELDPGIKKHIVETLNLEMVLGGDRFKHQIQLMVDRPVRPKKRGRPPKEAKR